MSRRILTCRVKIAHVTQEPMHMSASPWIIVRKHWRKGKNAVRVSYPAYTESLNNPQDMIGRGCSSSNPDSWSSGLGRREYLIEKQTNKQKLCHTHRSLQSRPNLWGNPSTSSVWNRFLTRPKYVCLCFNVHDGNVRTGVRTAKYACSACKLHSSVYGPIKLEVK